VIFLKKFISGLLAGILIVAGVTAGAQSVRQYTAKEVSYPILVNGQMFITDKPIVSINGSTYLPLAVIGDALGVKVSWNSKKSRVEIGEAIIDSENTDNTRDYLGWVPYSTSDPELLMENILNGNVVYYNGQYLASPEYMK
jgi:hypothetical protein